MSYKPNSARLAKNTILLYGRMVLMMCINLYTSRIVLQALGIEDYGIFNVVGGVIVMFSFLTDSMTASTQRFLTFELGVGNKEKLHAVFITSIHIHLLISLVIIILGETVGLWFLVEKMVIPPERMVAAHWVYQFSIFMAVLNVLSYPYISAIIAHEKIKSFAYVAILDALLKLLMVYLLLAFDYDRLILYAALYAGEKLLIRFIYNIYCVRNFEECKYKWIYQKALFKEMSLFAVWKLWGCMAFVFYTYGLNLLLNVFFGPVVNAARAAAYHGYDAVSNFAMNFQTAMNPQITKTYASRQLEETHKLIYKSVRLTFCMLLILCLPLIVEAPAILGLWLVEVPEGTATFLRLLLVILMIQQSSNALATAIASTGKIKRYEMSLGILMLTIVPISYIVLRLGGAPWSVFVVFLAVVMVAFFLILSIVLPMIKLKLKDYFRYAIGRCVTVLILSLIVPFAMQLIKVDGLLYSFINIAVIVISTAVIAYFFGLDREERRTVLEKVKNMVAKLK